MVKQAEQTPAVQPSGSSAAKIILIAVTVAVISVGGSLGGLFYLGVIPARASVPAGEESAATEPRADAIYVGIHPTFTANFEKKGKAKFLQVKVEVMTRDPDMEQHIKAHMPAIRNDLLMLFSNRSSDSVSTSAGKEALRQETLVKVQEILARETGSEGVEAVYFTSFVME